MIQRRLAGSVCWILAQSGRFIFKILTFPLQQHTWTGLWRREEKFWPWDTTAGYRYCSATTSKALVAVE